MYLDITISWGWMIGIVVIFTIIGAAGWQFIRSNNKPIADKADSDTQKIKQL